SELAEKDGPLKSVATEALATGPGLSEADQNRLLRLLEALSPANIKRALLAADLRIQLNPGDAAKIYDQTVARWNAAETSELIELARWLNLHGQPEQVISLFSI